MPITLNARQRVLATLARAEVDRPPITAWRRFLAGGSGRQLADATARFALDDHQLDLVVLGPSLGHPVATGSVGAPTGWEQLGGVDDSLWREEHAVAVRHLRQRHGTEIPLVAAVNAPMTEAARIVGELPVLAAHAERATEQLEEGLASLAAMSAGLAETVLTAGADGILYLVEGATERVMSEKRYRQLAEHHDRAVLELPSSDAFALVHLEGSGDLFLELAAEYPVSGIGWPDRTAGPSIAEVRQTIDLPLMGGLDHTTTLVDGPPAAVEAEVVDAWEGSGRRGLILAPGSELGVRTSPGLLRTARRAAEDLASA